MRYVRRCVLVDSLAEAFDVRRSFQPGQYDQLHRLLRRHHQRLDRYARVEPTEIDRVFSTYFSRPIFLTRARQKHGRQSTS